MIKQKAYYYKAFLSEPSIYNLVGDLEPRIDPFAQVFEDVSASQAVAKLDPLKQKIAKLLIDGWNFNQIAHKLGIKPSRMYRIKNEMRVDLDWLRKQNDWCDSVDDENVFLDIVKNKVSTLSIADFTRIFIADYDTDSGLNWFSPALSQEIKLITVISYLIRRLFLRTQPEVIDYYFDDREYLVDMVRKFKRLIRLSPIVNDCLQPVACDDDFGIKLKDGSAIRTYYSKRKSKNRGSLVIIDSQVSVNSDREIVLDGGHGSLVTLPVF